jgi:hypothetical protein
MPAPVPGLSPNGSVAGRDGVFGEDIGVFYPLIVFWGIAFPPHHVQEVAVIDFHLKDLLKFPSDIVVRLEDGWWFVTPGVSWEWVWLHELEFHYWRDQMYLGIPVGKLKFVCTLSNDLHNQGAAISAISQMHWVPYAGVWF